MVPSSLGRGGEVGVFHLLVDYRGDLQQEHTPSTAENGNHGNHAPGSSSLLLVNCVAAAAPLTGPAYVAFPAFPAVSCERTR